MSWNIQTPGDYINGPLTVVGATTLNSTLTVSGVTQLNSNVGIGVAPATAIANNRKLEIGGAINTAVVLGSNSVTASARNWAVASNWNTYGDLVFLQSNALGGDPLASGAGTTRMMLDASGSLGLGNVPVSNFRLTAIGGFASGLGGAYIETGEFNRYGLVINNSNASAATNLVEIRKASVALAAFTAAGNLAFGNGLGIDFSAAGNTAGMTSEILNDYEEGTWIGTLKGSTSDPTVAVTATGRYTKVGRQVSVQIEFNNISTAGAAGSVYVIGIPFTSSSAGGNPGSVLSFSGITFTETLGCILGGNATSIEIYSIKSNSSWVAATHNAGTGRYLWLNVTYTV